MHGLAPYLKEGLPFAWYLSLENFVDSYLCFRPALLHSVSYFFLYWSPFFSCAVFDSILSNIDDVLSINATTVFALEDFIIHHEYWLTYSGGTDRPGELRWLTYLLRSLTVTLIVLLFQISFFLLTLIFVLQWLSLQWGILIILLSQFPLTFLWTKNRMPSFIA